MIYSGKYKVMFHHTPPVHVLKDVNGERKRVHIQTQRITICSIYEMETHFIETDRKDPRHPIVDEPKLKKTPLEEAELLYQGVALSDGNFDKEKNRKEALTQAIQSLPRVERIAIWEAYFNSKNDKHSHKAEVEACEA